MILIPWTLPEWISWRFVKSHNMIYRYDFTFDWYKNNAFICISFFFNKNIIIFQSPQFIPKALCLKSPVNAVIKNIDKFPPFLEIKLLSYQWGWMHKICSSLNLFWPKIFIIEHCFQTKFFVSDFHTIFQHMSHIWNKKKTRFLALINGFPIWTYCAGLRYAIW